MNSDVVKQGDRERSHTWKCKYELELFSLTNFYLSTMQQEIHFNILGDRGSIRRATISKSFSNINPSVEIQSTVILAASENKTIVHSVKMSFSPPAEVGQCCNLVFFLKENLS